MDDRMFRDFPASFSPGDCLVLNDSRVFPSRLYGHREHGSGGRVEVFRDPTDFERRADLEALVRPGRKMRTGERVIVDDA